MKGVKLYDTTLRDGAQGEGVSFSLADKLRIARRLSELGVHYIEGGWPGANPKDTELFARARDLDLGEAKLVAFGSTRRAGLPPEKDPCLSALLAADTPAVAVVGKSWTLHVDQVLRTSRKENLRMIADSVAFLKEREKEVIFDAEHFFDGFSEDPEYALATLEVAADAGADWLVLCDTNGGTLPWQVEKVVREVRREFPYVSLGIHAHNDCELAVANTLVAVQAGASLVQGTINGYGERCGNANLCSVIPNLQLKLGLEVLPKEKLRELTHLSYFVAELANLAPNPYQPYVGRAAFAHKGGIHVDALAKAPRSYRHIDPELVGNSDRVLVSELSGRTSILVKARELGEALSREEAARLLEEVKALEKKGFQFEAAEGSLSLLIRRARPDWRPPFELLDFLVLVEKRTGKEILSEATVKVKVGEEVIHTAAEGNGPVNALDRAIRKALIPFWPQLAHVRLTDYKVRILNGQAGTEATVRVLILASDGRRQWATVGSSPNIIEASWQALADSLEFPLVND
ncbi:TPA: citramalate synthase [Candidatus Acetothermia bacterium]|nr:citramalate synthase [Candidatus Acetothermia bacterium]